MRTSTTVIPRLGFGVHLIGDLLHQRMALVAHHGLEARGAEHAPQRRLEDSAEPGAGHRLVAHRLVKQQRIDDTPTRKGIDHEPLLVGGDNLLRRGIEVEQPLVEEHDVLNERNLVLRPGVVTRRLGLPNSSTNACCVW